MLTLQPRRGECIVIYVKEKLYIRRIEVYQNIFILNIWASSSTAEYYYNLDNNNFVL